MLSLDKVSIFRFDRSLETVASIDVHRVSDLAYSSRPVKIHEHESLAPVLRPAVVVDIIYQGETICRTALHYRLVVMRGVTL
jgi:hypothetical protein